MLPIKTRLTIKPWFDDQTLHDAEMLLEEGTCHILHYRCSCAALFAGLDGHCLINFIKAPQISQGFLPDQVDCSICNYPQSMGGHCVHAAVLIIKILLQEEVDGFGLNLPPAPLLFADSKWQQVCAFLNDNKTYLKILQDDDHLDTLTFETKNFSARISLHENTRTVLTLIFPNYKFPEHAAADLACEAVANAWLRLFISNCTDTETALNEVGTISKGQEDARSIWAQICQQLFLEQPKPKWLLRRGANNLFALLSDPTGETGLCLTPSREKTISLLKQTDSMDLITVNGTARAYAKIYFQEDGRLTIEPWLELDNGVRQPRSALVDCIFGPYCSIEGNTFQLIQEHSDDFSPTPKKGGSLPLLALAAKGDPADPITIPALEVPSFLDKHLHNILSGDHDYDPNLEEFSIHDLPDFIEILDYNEDADWCYLSARYACGSRHLDLQDILALRRQGQQHATGRGKWLQVNNTPLDWLYNLEPERLREDKDGSTLRLTRLEMMALTALVPELQLPREKEKNARIKARLQNLEVKDLAPADIPPHLRPYQQTGLAWLHHLFANSIGGILADDMGLGKTHQALALLQIILRAQGGPALVVCPASVLPHWQDKIDSFYPDLDYVVHYGPKRQLSPPTPATVILTTYGIMRQDIELLAPYEFGPIFFDEIQYLKNRGTSTHKAASCLHGRACFGLSGTPIENSLTDLKSIYDICLPGLLGGHSYFQRTYVAPIEDNNDQGRLKTLQCLISPFMLRRHKKAVLTELPEVIEDIRHCHLSADQQTLYRQAIDHEGRELLAAVSDTTAPFPHMSFLALVQQLKQICNHPCQLAKSTDYDKYSSGKWELFKEILQECLEAGLKVVVFSQYTKMLDIINQYLLDMAIPHAGLRGSTTMDKRRQQLEAFNNDPAIKVFCASLLAGGTGIDLTGAQAVIHYDRWWNSAKEEQATARVHRFGQQQAVQVFKFITTGTMEEKIHNLISKKQNLAEGTVQTDDGSILKKLSRDEISAILQWSPKNDD